MKKILCGAAAALSVALVCVCAYTLNAQNYTPADTAPLAAKLAEGVSALIAPSVSPAQSGTQTEPASEPAAGSDASAQSTPDAAPVQAAASAPSPAPDMAAVPPADTAPSSTPTVEVMGETTPKPDSSSQSASESKPESGSSSSGPESDAQSASSSSESQKKPPVPLTKNPLTGLPFAVAIETRPVAVMIDNVQGALPQRGLQGADIVYESVTEGGVTRLAAFYGDAAAMPQAGPVCAARDQFVQMLLPVRAACVHVGSSDYARTLWAQYPDAQVSLDGATQPTLLTLDNTRKASMRIEYCWFTAGALLGGAAVNDGAVPDALPFAAADAEKAALGGGSAQDVYVRFSSYANSSFAYDAARGVYVKSQFGAPHIDENTGEALTFDNLLILFASESRYPDGAQTKVDFAAGGEGRYISGGQYETIRWGKAAADAPLTLTRTDGTPLAVNCGRTYIATVGSDMAGLFQITAAPAEPETPDEPSSSEPGTPETPDSSEPETPPAEPDSSASSAPAADSGASSSDSSAPSESASSNGASSNDVSSSSVSSSDSASSASSAASRSIDSASGDAGASSDAQAGGQTPESSAAGSAG